MGRIAELANKQAYLIVYAQAGEILEACDAIREKHGNWSTIECISDIVEYLASWDFGKESELEAVRIRDELSNYDNVYKHGEYVLIVGPTGIYYALYRLA